MFSATDGLKVLSGGLVIPIGSALVNSGAPIRSHGALGTGFCKRKKLVSKLEMIQIKIFKSEIQGMVIILKVKMYEGILLFLVLAITS